MTTPTRARLSRILGTAALALFAVACANIGTGPILSQDRPVSDFDAVHVNSGIRLELTVDPDEEPSVKVRANGNLLDDVSTRVDAKRLIIEVDGPIPTIGSRTVEVTTPALRSLDVSGGATVAGTGEADRLRINISGGSRADLEALEASSIDLRASGGSHLSIHATELVEGEASGGADIVVLGDPQGVFVSTTGGADLSVEGR